MDELGNFGGHIVALEKDGETLSIRFLSWNAYDEDIKPVFSLNARSYRVLSNSAPTLEEVKDSEYEVDGIEIENNRISIWVYDFEDPVLIECEKVQYQFEELGPLETKMVLSASRKSQEEQYKEIIELRKRVETVEKFISETERRILIKSESHSAGSEGDKMYKGQLELLSRIKCKLNT